MEVMHRIIAGLDVHAKQVVACLRVQQGRRCRRILKQFSTTTPGLLDLHAWLIDAHCPIVLIESTGVYWQPIFNILEGSIDVILANAQHVKTLPGRKTDLRDAEWLAELGAHGLVRASFIPPAPIRELRELTRYRTHLIQMRSQQMNRCISCWNRPTSSWARWSRICSGPRAERCCARSSRGSRTPSV